MSISFEFNAPHFIDKSEDPDADKFFDAGEEAEVTFTLSPNLETKRVLESRNVETENKDPCSTSSETPGHKTTVARKVLYELNLQSQNDKSIIQSPEISSTANEKQLSRAFEKMSVTKDGSSKKGRKTPFRKTEIFDGIEIERVEKNKTHSMVTRFDSQIKTPVLNLRSRRILLREPLNLQEQNEGHGNKKMFDLRKSVAIKRKSSPVVTREDFVSLAEKVQHFHYDTPDRFRTIPKQPLVSQNLKLRQTVPKTPVLSTRFRQRPINCLSQKEREDLEIQELKKHQVKAHPLNEKILREPVLNLKNPIEKRPSTVPQPFNLTEVKKKDQPQTPVFVFRAQPVKTTILNGPVGIPDKKVSKATIPMTPKIKAPLRHSTMQVTPAKKSNTDFVFSPKRTKVQPFSFDEKIKELFKKRQENMRKVIEEEKKAFNSFKAQPLPHFLQRGNISHNNSPNKPGILTSNFFTGDKKEVDTTINKSDFIFKARPATVLHEKPFLPTLPKHDSILPEEIVLNTEKRAVERQKFDERIRKKEEMHAQILRERQEEQERLEELKKQEERKLTEFKAKPVPKYKPFEIVPSDPSNLTSPKTPKFMSKKK